jgi:hypothetical protein
MIATDHTDDPDGADEMDEAILTPCFLIRVNPSNSWNPL